MDLLRRIFRWIFSPWTLLLLLVLVAAFVIWFIGPLVAIGEARPLDTERSRWITIGVLLLVVVLVVAWRQWRARRGNQHVVQQLAAPPAGAAPENADLAVVRERFESALATLRKVRFGPAAQSGKGVFSRIRLALDGRYLYQLPWYMFVGAPGSGKTTALRNAGLRFPLAGQAGGEQAVRGVGGTRNCDWWFTDEAVLIDTAGRFTTQDSDAANDKATWNGFLGLLKRARPRQPLNGVLVTVSVSELIARPAAERAKLAERVRQRLQELHEQLGARFPIYLLVTKCDLMAGFADHFATLDKDQRATPWGFTFAQAPQAWATAYDPEYDLLVARLNAGLVDRLQTEADPARRARLYGFPNQFVALRAPLHEFVQQVFSPSPYAADPMLRGVYFVSGTQEGSPIDRVLGAVARRFALEQQLLPPQASSGKSFFLQRLLTDVVFAEAGLASTDARWEGRRRALVIACYALLGLVSVGLITAWAISWSNNKAYIAAVGQRVEQVRLQVQQTPNRASSELPPLLPAFDAVRNLAQTGTDGAASGSVPWSLGFGLYQGNKLDGAARVAYERMLGDALLPRLALRVEEQLRSNDQSDALYESLKSYLMLFDAKNFDAVALKGFIEADWDQRLTREIAADQREALTRHLDALLALGPAVSPLPQDKALVTTTRERLAALSLPQRVFNRMRQQGLGNEFPEFTIAKAGGPGAAVVFKRESGLPLTRGVNGLFTHNGYHKGFQKVVADVTRQLAMEQSWVLGIDSRNAQGVPTTADPRLLDDVRRLYLTEYRDTWKSFIADIRLIPPTSLAQSLERTRFLAAPDSPLLPLMRAISRETTLLAGAAVVDQLPGRVESKVKELQTRVLGSRPATTGAPGERIESIVDEEFAKLRFLVTAPEGGKAPLEFTIARLGELQQLLMSIDNALKGGGTPPTSPLPQQIKIDAANAPEPVRSMLDTLASNSARVSSLQLREGLSREVRAQVGEFCAQATSGRYPFDASSTRDVTLDDFAKLFGPGGKFEQMQGKLAPFVDTSRKPWSFRPVDGAPLGADVGTLPQFQRAAVIRETFFGPGGGVATTKVEFKPVEMDASLREITLDIDGQIVRYAHGPQIPAAVQWPGPRGTNVVRVMAQPAGSTGMVAEGPWALYRLFDRVNIVPGSSPEKFRATFDIDGRKAVFDVTTSSVRNPFRLPELRGFACPQGL